MPKLQAVRTRTLLIAGLSAVIVTVTSGSLLIVRDRVRTRVAQDLSNDLQRSLETFRNLQRQRRDELIHENALIANLPSLKALMTTHDQKTIADGAIDVWKLSGSDLFALADNEGRVLTVYTQGKTSSTALAEELKATLSRPEEHYVFSDNRLFDISVRPLYFGDETRGTLLGYVVSGYAINNDVTRLISRASGDEAAFLAGRQVMASTLPALEQQELPGKLDSPGLSRLENFEVRLGVHRYLVTETNLSGEIAGQLHLIILKSFEPADRATREINRLVLLLGVAAMALGSLLMIALSRIVTEPLELLAKGVRAFGYGDTVHELPDDGTKEVRELSVAFARMRSEIVAANSALLRVERLATIGSMASSVSHDLRHYFAAVYANAEFLSSSDRPEEERAELLAEIQIAVHGATELLDSLLIFSKAGSTFHRERDSVVRITEKAILLLRAHPEAEGVTIRRDFSGSPAAWALIDAKQLQRAIYNLLLNACQSARAGGPLREVTVAILAVDEQIRLTVTDSGPGVPLHIRSSLFEPFVSEGKQSGTGLGLTLANAVAKEHGGAVTLIATQPGETTFQLSLHTNLSETQIHLVAEGATAPGLS